MFLQSFGIPESTLILVFMFGIVLVGIVLAALAMYAEYRKEMALVESGQYPVEHERSDGRAWVLAAGLLLLGFGVGSIVDGLAVGATGLPGAIPAFVGLAALAYYFVRRREDRRGSGDGRANAE
ncbi:DUF6249 domain-containing protein [Haloglomus litoreum]|uniref:DUF6249 domain-containing protein n=1 Tax=Haloglomus litoreum TaxID=3034026 RepID=UPI0023E7EA53|nr:DUF6249 domain-containing protein [Haloglomus sp. DT116]